MTGLAVGVVRETGGEHRVALDPKAVATLVGDERRVLVELDAGLAASFADAVYETAGAVITSRESVVSDSDVLAVVHPPDDTAVAAMHSGQVLIGLLDPLNNLTTVQALSDAGVTAVAFELLPRTLSRAQAMDALSSQSSAAGYRAAIVAAEAFGRYFSMMITASGTATLRDGSVCIDLGSSDLGGNVPASSSQMYARNVVRRHRHPFVQRREDRHVLRRCEEGPYRHHRRDQGVPPRMNHLAVPEQLTKQPTGRRST